MIFNASGTKQRCMAGIDELDDMFNPFDVLGLVNRQSRGVHGVN